MLHPSAPGNGNVDLRGLCYYGSLACRSFLCPSWEELPAPYADATILALKDWHLYGLVATDPDFVLSLFGIIEEMLGHEIDPTVVVRSPSRQSFVRLLRWKDAWPFKGSSLVRRSRHYLKKDSVHAERNLARNIARILDCMKFTFDNGESMTGLEEFILRNVGQFVTAYRTREARSVEP
jgi:hypothetical protein